MDSTARVCFGPKQLSEAIFSDCVRSKYLEEGQTNRDGILSVNNRHEIYLLRSPMRRHGTNIVLRRAQRVH